MSTAGKNLKYLRKLRGWTQEEFAAKLQIKRSLRQSEKINTLDARPQSEDVREYAKW